MYNFVDTTERYPGQNLPSEALMFNGSYLENVIPGYRTLYVSGREILGTEITDLETGVSDGTKYRLPAVPCCWTYSPYGCTSPDRRTDPDTAHRKHCTAPVHRN